MAKSFLPTNHLLSYAALHVCINFSTPLDTPNDSWNGPVLSAARSAAGVLRMALRTVLAIRDPEFIGRSLGGRWRSSLRFLSIADSLLRGVSTPADTRAEQTVGKALGSFASKQLNVTKD